MRRAERSHHLPRLSLEDHLVELWDELTRSDRLELAPAGGRPRVLRDLARHLGEIGPRANPRECRLRLRPRRVLGLASADERHAHEDVRDARAGRLLELAPPILVRGLHLGVGHRREGHACAREDRRQDPAALGWGELGGVPFVVRLHLRIADRGPLVRGVGRHEEVRGPDPLALRLPVAADLRVGDLHPLGDQRLELLPEEVAPEAGFEHGGRELRAGQQLQVALP